MPRLTELGTGATYHTENPVHHFGSEKPLRDAENFLPEAQLSDAVNHPQHYTNDPSGVECITITRHRNFNIGNAIKYLWRAGLKFSPGGYIPPLEAQIEDLEKARWYIADEIERLKKEHEHG